jgi:hypothetical protein
MGQANCIDMSQGWPEEEEAEHIHEEMPEVSVHKHVGHDSPWAC